MDISKFKTDESRKDGAWFSYEGAEFLIAYAHRPEFVRASARLKRRYPDSKIKADPALGTRFVCELMAETVLLDWRGVTNDGVPVKYTPEKAVKILMEIEPFREWVAETSRELTNYVAEAEAEDAAALKSRGGMEAEVGEG